MSLELNIIPAVLPVNQWTRPGNAVRDVRGIVNHWAGNPGTTARANIDWLASLAADPNANRYTGAHYFVDFDGRILNAIPESEIAYHCGTRGESDTGARAWSVFQCNPIWRSLGIEWVHEDWSGEPTQETYRAAATLNAALCAKYKLDPMTSLFLHSCTPEENHPDAVARHKRCHLWFLDNPDEWEAFKEFVGEVMLTRETAGLGDAP